ncbi:hypothetical protein BJV77DRAFT_516828 [Russula vinacea]|nr:hypothetical protein BJV77DRAFT_516828 [Russula vinacea]
MLWSHINSVFVVCSIAIACRLRPTSPFDPLLYHVRSLLSLFLALLTTIYLHQKRRNIVALAYLVHPCVSFRSPSSFLTLHHQGHLTMYQKAALEALEANIMEASTNHELVHSRDKNHRACVSIGTDCFVKFGDPDALWLNSKLSHTSLTMRAAHSPGGAPLRRQQDKYLIIELIMLTAAPLNLVGRTTQTLVWLSSVPPPPDHVIRPLGGGHIRHKFFKEYMAPLLSSASRPYNGTCARRTRCSRPRPRSSCIPSR